MAKKKKPRVAVAQKKCKGKKGSDYKSCVRRESKKTKKKVKRAKTSSSKIKRSR